MAASTKNYSYISYTQDISFFGPKKRHNWFNIVLNRAVNA
jgi:hypothetical protein